MPATPFFTLIYKGSYVKLRPVPTAFKRRLGLRSEPSDEQPSDQRNKTIKIANASAPVVPQVFSQGALRAAKIYSAEGKACGRLKICKSESLQTNT